MSIRYNLPDAPDAGALGVAEESGVATLSGEIVGPNGTAIEGASIALTTPGMAERVLVSDAHGAFVFRALPAGTFRLTVTTPGLQTYTQPEIVLKGNDALVLPPITLALTGDTATVQVTATTVEIAQEQIREQEKQRVLGVLPNFYTSFVWDAAPLNARQKFNLAAHSVLDPVSFVGVGIVAGAQQAADSYHQYGQGTEGYAKRYGADYADTCISRMLGSAVLPSLLHQDPRYFYKGTGTKKQRALYAVSRTLITRGDNGRSQFNYSRVFGNFGAGALANAYYPSHDRGAGLTITNGVLDLVGTAVDNLAREFISRRVTSNVPDYKQGQQSAASDSAVQK